MLSVRNYAFSEPTSYESAAPRQAADSRMRTDRTNPLSSISFCIVGCATLSPSSLSQSFTGNSPNPQFCGGSHANE